MPNLLDRLAASVGFVRSPKTKPSYATGPMGKFRVQSQVQGFDPRRGAAMMRNFSRNNKWVRLAINYRRQQISKAQWKLVRIDDPKATPDDAVVKRVRELFRFVNPKRESFKTLLDMVIDDILVLDAGCIEKEKNFGGQIVAMYGVDGSTIIPDPGWDGSDPNATRYYQIINGREVAQLRNDQLVYMMGVPTTYSPIGWSVVETLMRAIEADLYGDDYDFRMLKQTAPAGILSLGPGVTADTVTAFRTYYEEEIAGSQDVAIFGGGEPGAGAGVSWEPFGRSARDNQRAEYRDFVIKAIAAVFQVDKGLFNITESVNRSTSRTQQERTDEGLEGLADLLEEYISREIIAEIDDRHGFKFDGLSDRDEAKQAEIDSTLVGSGILTVNEIRAQRGLDPVEWGDAPFLPTVGPVSPEVPEEQQPEDDANPPADDEENDDKPGKKGSAKRVAPFVQFAASQGARMRSERLRYLADFTESSETSEAG